jgi:hypothetical protein
MKDLSKLESVIYERELKELSMKLAKGVELIREALKPYHNSSISNYHVTETTISVPRGGPDQFNEWLNSLPMSSSHYFGGDHLSVSAPSVKSAPEFIQKAVLGVAVAKFLAQVAQVEEIAGQVQILERQANS